MTAERGAIRVVVQQPALPKYRLPVFAALAKRPGIDLKVVYGQTKGLANVEAAGFEAEYWALRVGYLGRHPVMWHGAQWRYASRRRADVLVLSWDLHYVTLIPALLRARLSGVPTVLWGHGYSKREAGWRAWLRERVARLGRALLLYNHTAAKGFVEQGWDPGRVFVALNTVDQGPIQEAREYWLTRPGELEAFRRENGLSEGPMVLFVSRLDPENHVDWLIEAVGKLKERFAGLRVVVIGGGPDRERLEGLAGSMGVGDRVRFLGAVYGERELAPWFLSAQVFCYPANIGLSLLHAFGYGLPVVTSDWVASQNPEIEALRDGENGLLYRHGDVGALAGALERVLSDEGMRTRLSVGAYETATQEFTLENMVDGFEAAIRYCHGRGWASKTAASEGSG